MGTSPRGAPTAAVQGHARVATASPGSCFNSLAAELVDRGVSHPASWSVRPGVSQSVIRRWLRHARVVLASHANAWYATAVRGIETLHDYAQWQPHRSLNPVVYGSAREKKIRVSSSCSPLGIGLTLSAMGTVPVIKATPSDLAGFVLVMQAHQSLLRMLSFIAPRTVLCENGGVLELDQGNGSICQHCLAPPQSPTVPARLQTTYALLAVYVLPLRRVKCDATDALRRTVVSRLMV